MRYVDEQLSQVLLTGVTWDGDDVDLTTKLNHNYRPRLRVQYTHYNIGGCL